MHLFWLSHIPHDNIFESPLPVTATMSSFIVTHFYNSQFSKQICDLDNNVCVARLWPWERRWRVPDTGSRWATARTGAWSSTPSRGSTSSRGPMFNTSSGMVRTHHHQTVSVSVIGQFYATQIFGRCNINFLNAHVLVYGWRVHFKKSFSICREHDTPAMRSLMNDPLFLRHLELFLERPSQKIFHELKSRAKTLRRRRTDEVSTRFFLRD